MNCPAIYMIIHRNPQRIMNPQFLHSKWIVGIHCIMSRTLFIYLLHEYPIFLPNKEPKCQVTIVLPSIFSSHQPCEVKFGWMYVAGPWSSSKLLMIPQILVGNSNYFNMLSLNIKHCRTCNYIIHLFQSSFKHVTSIRSHSFLIWFWSDLFFVV